MKLTDIEIRIIWFLVGANSALVLVILSILRTK